MDLDGHKLTLPTNDLASNGQRDSRKRLQEAREINTGCVRLQLVSADTAEPTYYTAFALCICDAFSRNKEGPSHTPPALCKSKTSMCISSRQLHLNALINTAET